MLISVAIVKAYESTHCLSSTCPGKLLGKVTHSICQEVSPAAAQEVFQQVDSWWNTHINKNLPANLESRTFIIDGEQITLEVYLNVHVD